MKSNRDRCAINVYKDSIPDVGLGRFIEGYNNKKDPFNYKIFWWLLLPIVGWIAFAILVLIWLLSFIFTDKNIVYIYDDGFLWYSKTFYGKKTSTVIRYNEISNIYMYRTRQIRIIYGFEKYDRTDVDFRVAGKQDLLLKKKFFYVNKNEDINKYSALMYAAMVIMQRWDALKNTGF